MWRVLEETRMASRGFELLVELALDKAEESVPVAVDFDASELQ